MSAGMPTPLSEAVMATKSPSNSGSMSPRESVRFSAVKAKRPPSGMASRALTAMLTRASSSSLGSASTGQSVSGRDRVSSMLAFSELVSIWLKLSKCSDS